MYRERDINHLGNRAWNRVDHTTLASAPRAAGVGDAAKAQRVARQDVWHARSLMVLALLHALSYAVDKAALYRDRTARLLGRYTIVK